MPIDKSIDYSEATPYICELSRKCIGNSSIDPALYTKYDVKRGLRDLNGNGVLTGLTEISDIVAFEMKDGVKTPCEGRLYYRGVNVRDIVRGFVTEGRFGFEEVVYLLLFGELPKEQELEKFRAQLSAYRALPTNFAVSYTHLDVYKRQPMCAPAVPLRFSKSAKGRGNGLTFPSSQLNAPAFPSAVRRKRKPATL